MRLTRMLRAAVRLTLPPPLSTVLPAACKISRPADRWIAPPPLAPSQPRPAPATRSALSKRSLVAPDAVRLMPPLPARMPTPWSSAGLLSTVMLPLAAAAVGVLFLGEAVGVGHFVALALALLGLLLATWPSRPA